MKKLLSTVLAVVVMLPALFASANYYGYGQNYYNGYGDVDFYDVPSSYPYYDSIYWMRNNDVVSGYSDGNFRPDICVNRAEFLKMMFEVANTEDDIFDYPHYSTVHYSDVHPGDWFYPYVVAATYEGAVRGYVDGSFKPGNCVTRAEAIKVASLYFNDGDLPEIDDYEFRIVDNDFRQWYFPFVDYASRSNTVGLYHAIPASSGFDEDAYFYLPEAAMTRGEVAEMLYRLEYITDNNDDVYEGGRYNGSNNNDEISCKLELGDDDFDPSRENLRIDYELGRYEDSRVRVELTVEYPNNDELELRDSILRVDEDYTYYWNGEENDEYVNDGRYEIELRVRDRDNNRTICTETERFSVDNSESDDNLNNDDSDNSNDNNSTSDSSDNSVDYADNSVNNSNNTVNYDAGDYNYYYTSNYDYDSNYYYYYYNNNNDYSVDNSDNSTSDSSDNSNTTNNTDTDSSDNGTDDNNGSDNSGNGTDDNNIVVSCDLTLSASTLDPSDENLFISYGIGDFEKETFDVKLVFDGIGVPMYTLVDKNLRRNTNHTYNWTGRFGVEYAQDSIYEVRLELRDPDTSELVCTSKAKLTIQD